MSALNVAKLNIQVAWMYPCSNFRYRKHGRSMNNVQANREVEIGTRPKTETRVFECCLQQMLRFFCSCRMSSYHARLLDFLRFFRGHVEEETGVSVSNRVPDIADFNLSNESIHETTQQPHLAPTRSTVRLLVVLCQSQVTLLAAHPGISLLRPRVGAVACHAHQ